MLPLTLRCIAARLAAIVEYIVVLTTVSIHVELKLGTRPEVLDLQPSWYSENCERNNVLRLYLALQLKINSEFKR